LYVFKLVCTRWENFIRIGITVLYLKSWRCQLWIWRSQISVLLAPLRVPLKRHFRPSNPQLTPPTLQTQYCYSLNIRSSIINPNSVGPWLFLHCSSIFLLKEDRNRLFFFNSFISALIMTIWCFILICRTYYIRILRAFLYFQNWNWEKNFEVCTLQPTTSRQMVSTFIFGINKCMQKDRKKGTETLDFHFPLLHVLMQL
jgi:hypothetical protein